MLKCVKCRLFVVPGNDPALLGMQDIELFSRIGVMCEQIDSKMTDRKFDTHTRCAADSHNYKSNRCLQEKLDADNVNGDKTIIPNYLNSSTNRTHMPDYLYSSDNKEANKRLSETITNRIHNEFNDQFSSIGCFEGTFSLQIQEGSHQYQASPRSMAYAL